MEKNKKKIIIVAPEPEAGLIKGLLQEDLITLTSNGAVAIDKIRAEAPEIIILDSEPTNIDIEEFIMIIKGNEDTRNIPIILLCSEQTGRFPDNKDITFFIRKPVNKENLLQTIKSIHPILPVTKGKKRVLIVDDNSATRKKIIEALEKSHYSIFEAKTGLEVLRKVPQELPDIIVLDIILPDMNGFKILKQLKADVITKHIPVILLSAIEKAEEKAKGLLLGAADYITKPFSDVELRTRIGMLLERTEAEYSASPTTRLPGNISIEKEITTRIMKKLPFAVCYCDLDDFKAYNDTYGFLKGDSIIKLTAKIIMDTMKDIGNNDDFLGHIGGDDFVFITTPDKVDMVCNRVIEAFDRVIPFYYDKETRQKGYIEGFDRQGRKNQFPIMSISIAVVSNAHREIRHIGEVSDIAVELKKMAKSTPGSIVVKDKRKEKFITN